MTEKVNEGESRSEEQIQTEIDRLDILKAALPEVDGSDPEIAEQESAYQEKIWELQAKLYESKLDEERSRLLADYLARNSGYYAEFVEMGIPLAPEVVWNDFFGSYTEMTSEAEEQIQIFLNNLEQK